MMLSFEQALLTVRDKLNETNPNPATETLALDRVRSRVLGEDVLADRDYPPFHRATRDGYAVRSNDLKVLPAVLQCVGEVRAGEAYSGKLERPGECVQIMTGAPLPEGTDSVLMLENARPDGTQITALRALAPFEYVVKRGSETAAGSRVLPRGRRLGAGEMGLLASVGKARVSVFRQPTVAILPTGDEVVPVEQTPLGFQIRNSNGVTLAALVAEAGGVPHQLVAAPDEPARLRDLIEQGLNCDLLLVSGGVSMGKYDFVEQALSELGAKFSFQGVAIRPGKPLVFGRVRERFFFGLPGNPVSTFVTFRLFVRAAIGLLGGMSFELPTFYRARLGKPARRSPGLTAFLPARVDVQRAEPVVELVGWQGSGDLVGLAQANCLLVIRPEQSELAEGDWVEVWPL